jgi:molybdenum cofactor guanylyltransferase
VSEREAVPPPSGLILCGGGSRRMGQEKALIPVEGRPLVLRVAERLGRISDPVILAPGQPGRLGELGFPEVADEVPEAGPLGGLCAGLAASPHALMAVVAADMPFASPEVMALLARALRGEDAVVPVTPHGREPLHAVYATAALPIMREALAGGRLALRRVLLELRVRTVPETEWHRADPSGRFALNLNRAEDMALLR